MDLQWQDPRSPLLTACGGSDAEQMGPRHWKVIWEASALPLGTGAQGFALSSPEHHVLVSTVTASTMDDRDDGVDVKRPGEKRLEAEGLSFGQEQCPCVWSSTCSVFESIALKKQTLKAEPNKNG